MQTTELLKCNAIIKLVIIGNTPSPRKRTAANRKAHQRQSHVLLRDERLQEDTRGDLRSITRNLVEEGL